MCAHAGDPGSSCKDAIPMGKNYSATVKNGQTIWYSAWTFDLPLTVTFAPKNGKNDPAPEVEMDFTCTPGIYEDSILCSLFCQTSSGSGVQFDMPHKPKLETKTLDDDTFVYYLSLGERYRDLLLQMGISYNLEVYVKVTYKCNGVISMAPDDLFSNCVDNAPFMHIGDVVQVQAKDKKNHVIIPYVQWQEDTIIYKWTGTQPCTLAVANTCDFDPTNNNDPNLIQFTINPIQPGDSIKVKAETIYKWVHNKEYPNKAGMYFAKFYSEAPGSMKITKAPQAPPQASATLLRLDRTYALNAHETGLFAFPKSWDQDDTVHTIFTTPTEHLFRMTISTDADFADEHILKVYDFAKDKSGRFQGIYGSEMKAFWKKTKEQYLYVRFDCSEATTITSTKWIVDKCISGTKNYIHSLDTTFEVKRNSTGGNYRFNYSQWVGGDLEMTFSVANKCSVYVATDCDIAMSTNVQTAPNLLYYDRFTTSKNTITISADEIASWAPRITADGYFYMRIQHVLSGYYSMKIKSNAPKDADPVYPTSTIAVACEGTKIVVNVSKAQTIRVYDAASAQKAEWNAEPGTPQELVLPVGKYTLVGENEKIEINL